MDWIPTCTQGLSGACLDLILGGGCMAAGSRGLEKNRRGGASRSNRESEAWLTCRRALSHWEVSENNGALSRSPYDKEPSLSEPNVGP